MSFSSWSSPWAFCRRRLLLRVLWCVVVGLWLDAEAVTIAQDFLVLEACSNNVQASSILFLPPSSTDASALNVSGSTLVGAGSLLPGWDPGFLPSPPCRRPSPALGSRLCRSLGSASPFKSQVGSLQRAVASEVGCLVVCRSFQPVLGSGLERSHVGPVVPLHEVQQRPPGEVRVRPGLLLVVVEQQQLLLRAHHHVHFRAEEEGQRLARHAAVDDGAVQAPASGPLSSSAASASSLGPRCGPLSSSSSAGWSDFSAAPIGGHQCRVLRGFKSGTLLVDGGGCSLTGEADEVRAYDVDAQSFRGRDAVTNADPDAAADLRFIEPRSKAEVVEMLRKHTFYDEGVGLLPLRAPQQLCRVRGSSAFLRPPACFLNGVVWTSGVDCFQLLHQCIARGPHPLTHVRGPHPLTHVPGPDLHRVSLMQGLCLFFLCVCSMQVCCESGTPQGSGSRRSRVPFMRQVVLLHARCFSISKPAPTKQNQLILGAHQNDVMFIHYSAAMRRHVLHQPSAQVTKELHRRVTAGWSTIYN